MSLDALVNAAGTWVEEPLAEVSYEDLRAFVDTDVSGALQITRAALPMLMQSGGRILHINGLQGADPREAAGTLCGGRVSGCAGYARVCDGR